jgi:branched-chain amino acid transport system substrate-binding protein
MMKEVSIPKTFIYILISVMVVLVIALSAGCAQPTQPAAEEPAAEEPVAEEPVAEEPEMEKVAKIGVMVPLTGGFGADAEDVVQAAQMAVDELNEAGGVAGYKLEVVPADTVDQRSDAVTSAFNRLNTTEDLNFIMTAYASTSNFEIDLMAEENMPYLLSANAAQTRDIISKDPSKYPTVWSRVPSYDGYNTELPVYLEKWADEGKWKIRDRTAYIISSDDPYGTTIANGLKETFEDMDWTVTGFETVPFASVTDWRGIIAKIRDNPPDIVVVTDSAPPNNAAFLNQFMENPTDSLVFLQYGPSVQEFLDLTKENSTGVIYNMLGGAIDTKQETQDIRARYEELYGHPGGYYAVIGYSEVMIYAQCLEKVGDPTDRLAMGKCIGETDMITPAGHLVFDQETHLATFGEDYYPILFYQIWDGERYLIEPLQYSTGEFRNPPWRTTE